MADSMLQTLGSEPIPQVAGSIGASKGFADSAVARVLAVVTAGIKAELDEAWASVAATFTDCPHLSSSTSVHTAHPWAPDAARLGTVGVTYPALFVYRDGEQTVEPLGLSRSKRVQRWRLDYVLGPLDAPTWRKLEPVCQLHVPNVLRRVIEDRSHSAHDSGRVQWGLDGSTSIMGFGDGRVTVESGPAVLSDDQRPMFACSCSFTVEEDGDFVDGVGAEMSGGVVLFLGAGPDGDMVDPYLVASTEYS